MLLKGRRHAGKGGVASFEGLPRHGHYCNGVYCTRVADAPLLVEVHAPLAEVGRGVMSGG